MTEAVSNQCPSCASPASVACKRSFLTGFSRCKCSKCGANVERPLTTGYRAVYWLFAVVFVLGVLRQLPTLLPTLLVALQVAPSAFVGLLVEQTPSILFAVGSIAALRKDARIRRRMGKEGTTDHRIATPVAPSPRQAVRTGTHQPTPAISIKKKSMMHRPATTPVSPPLGQSVGTRTRQPTPPISNTFTHELPSEREERAYVQAHTEYVSGTCREGLLVKAETMEGDRARQKALYVGWRVQQILDEEAAAEELENTRRQELASKFRRKYAKL